MRSDENLATGPFSYENWQAALTELPLRHTLEFPLFSDAHIIGGLVDAYGPYQLINTCRMGDIHPTRPAMILRVDDHVDHQLPQMNKTDTSRYHGGLLSDEIAALVSLSLGIRLKAGGESRMFGPDGDPKGIPISWGHSADPTLPNVHGQWIMPGAVAEHHMEHAAILSTFAHIPPLAAIALVRAARLFQEALWIVESTPELSWLMLTSAVETIAGYWREENESPIERFRASQALAPLEELLALYGDESFVVQVATFIEPYLGATKKFIDFILAFLPPPPKARPPEAFQVPWEPKVLKQCLSQVYAYRSKALHGGIPFPAPMSDAPHRFEPSSPPAEIPIGLGASTRGGVWMKKDLPMLIHTFEYIVRGALLNWWASVATESYREGG